MDPKTNLPPGYIPVEEAVEIIKANTRENPAIDMDYTVAHLQWIETGGNFRIPRIKRLAPEKIYKTKRGNTVEYVEIGEYNVRIENSFDKELLRKTIRDKYAELTHKQYKEIVTRARSTVADDAEGKDAVRPRANKPIAKEGASIGSSETVTTNGDSLTV